MTADAASDIEVLIPTAVPRIEERPLAPRIDDLAGKTIGLADNMKANAGALLDTVASRLDARYDDVEFIVTQKNASAAAPEEVMAQLHQCDAVILAIAD